MFSFALSHVTTILCHPLFSLLKSIPESINKPFSSSTAPNLDPVSSIMKCPPLPLTDYINVCLLSVSYGIGKINHTDTVHYLSYNSNPSGISITSPKSKNAPQFL